VAESTGTTVSVALGKVAHVAAPRFTVCPQPNDDVCTLGALPTGQSDELVAGASVQKAASAGEKITLTATVKASKAVSYHASATIDVVASPSPSSSPSSSSTSPSGADATLPGTSVPPLSPGAFTSPTNPAGLFPTVSPTSGTGASQGKGKKEPGHSDATTVSATLPLDSRLIGGQLAGLAVLASAIAIAIVRLSLRTSRPQEGTGSQK
jgi:hypothetical protein